MVTVVTPRDESKVSSDHTTKKKKKKSLDEDWEEFEYLFKMTNPA